MAINNNKNKYSLITVLIFMFKILINPRTNKNDNKMFHFVIFFKFYCLICSHNYIDFNN